MSQLARELLRVEAQQRVRGERDVGGLVERAPGAVVDGRPAATGRKRWISAAQLGSTLVRAHDERARPLERAERLQRLAEAHVVREHAPEPRPAQEASQLTPWSW